MIGLNLEAFCSQLILEHIFAISLNFLKIPLISQQQVNLSESLLDLIYLGIFELNRSKDENKLNRTS